ncbi:hypothetical protein CDAR_35601 [Caerostris darwini]|uniref:Uncharacterized protein n=1 Tax=Caerostris darwini TaxID=1538125 RepID=A0AAV4SME1_9ARAC|nr:hypothetical protein CDAR_35601 [Caerostris darwini]
MALTLGDEPIPADATRNFNQLFSGSRKLKRWWMISLTMTISASMLFGHEANRTILGHLMQTNHRPSIAPQKAGKSYPEEVGQSIYGMF